MRIRRVFFLLFLAAFFGENSFANTDVSGFMTPRDLLQNDSASNIVLHNNGNSTTTAYGLYIRQLSYVTPGSSCSSATVIYNSSENTTVGAFVMPVSIGAGKSAAVGSNYLYNMIYQSSYYVHTVIPSSPPGCSLPGCTWGDDHDVYQWCIYLGALAPTSRSSGYTSNIPPTVSEASSGSSYNYNLISSYSELGPITCDDQTLTCTTESPQTQSFS